MIVVPRWSRVVDSSWYSNVVEYYYTGRDGKGKSKCKKYKVDMKKHVNDDYALNKHNIDRYEIY